ncbi:agmatinase [Candidatus Micrarchaeota archaeon CG1_02_55_22]|nr:MAG: agmatinase [Candidatus Micrarchaeota archaeon CG1_02_55_22]
MKLLHSLPPYNFAGLENASFDAASVVVLPVPYDGTASYGSGAKEGPHAIISASRYLELSDYETGANASKQGIFTLDELEPARGNVVETCKRVEDAITQILESGKFPLTFGGDHSVAIGCIRAAAKKHSDLSVLALDAHLDCWDEFEGSDHSHASVHARVQDITPSVAGLGVRESIVGYRSAGENELAFCKEHGVKTFSSRQLAKDFDGSLTTALEYLGENVYVTLDLDVLDPSIMPAVGTPEPDGLSYNSVVNILEKVFSSKKVVGMDVCELAPLQGNRAPDFTAAKLAYNALCLRQRD